MRMELQFEVRSPRLCRHIHSGPEVEGPERGFARAGGVNGGTDIKEAVQDVVVHAGDLSRLLRLPPCLTRQLIVEVDLLTIIDDAQRGAGSAFLLAARNVSVGEAHANAFRRQE